MSWDTFITGKPIKGCTCGTCMYKRTPWGVSLTCGCPAFFMVEYDGFQLQPLDNFCGKIFTVKPRYTEDGVYLDVINNGIS